MISRVAVKNFRSIEDLELRPTALCALIGENNTGKSNILHAIRTVMAKDWLSIRDFSEQDVLDFDPSNDICIEVEFDQPPTYSGFASENDIEVPIFRFTLTRYKRNTAANRVGDPRLERECLDRQGEKITVLREAPKRGEKHKYQKLLGLPQAVKSQVPVIYIGADRQLSQQLPHTRYSLLRRLLEDVAETVKRTTREVDGEEKTLEEIFKERLGHALEMLRVPEFLKLEELVRWHALENLGYDPERDRERFAISFGLFDSMEFLKAIRLVVDEGGREMDATLLGDGAQNAVILAIFQAYEELKKQGAVFLIEEPEMYLHPHRARFLYETLRRISETNQVIYTTHSPHFVGIPFLEEVRLVDRDDTFRTRCRASSLEVTPMMREKLLKEFDPERNELFFARHVILVEGDTEKLALLAYAQRLGIDLNRQGCSIVEVGSKNDLPFFADVLQSFGIPHTLVFDEDVPSTPEGKGRHDEFNASLRQRKGGMTRVVMLTPKFEVQVEEELGSELYRKMEQRYATRSKPRFARLIAADAEAPVPSFVEDVFAIFSEGSGAGAPTSSEDLD